MGTIIKADESIEMVSNSVSCRIKSRASVQPSFASFHAAPSYSTPNSRFIFSMVQLMVSDYNI